MTQGGDTLRKALGSKLGEALISVLPVSVIVIILYFTPIIDLTGTELFVFLISTIALIIGVGLFNMGADIAMTPMGEHIGAGLTRTGKLSLLLGVSFLMGLFTTMAEPDLNVLAAQVKDVLNPTAIVLIVGIGVGIFLIISILKMLFNINISSIFLLFYMFIFSLAALLLANNGADFIPLAFDSGGVTTGAITVPFIMALGIGIAATLGGKNIAENSFGLLGMCSVGPIAAILFFGIQMSSKGSLNYIIPDYSVESGLGENFIPTVLSTVKEVGTALGLVVLFFVILQIIFLKLPYNTLGRITAGIIYTFVGLIIFLSAVTIGFMPVGYRLGIQLASASPALLIVFGFILGFVTVLAEPAVHVLNKQVEEITGGTVSKTSMMVALSIGVGVSIGLSMLRIVYHFDILYYLVPGYFISFALSFFVPGIYTAIAFDSGGVASGSLASSFMLPFAVGACIALNGEGAVMTDAFGIVAMISVTPLITIQMLGFRAVVKRRFSEKMAMRRMLAADDEQIIEFI
jgi:hypothetical protein